MTLARQLIPLPFSGGLDQKTDPKQVVPSKLLSITNADYSTLKEVKKRDQVVPFSVSTIATPTVLLANYKQELIACGGSMMSSYAETSNSFLNKGQMNFCSPGMQVACNDPGSSSASQNLVYGDTARTNDVKLNVWQSLDGIYYSFMEVATGQVLLGRTRLGGAATTAFAPKVIYHPTANVFIVFYIEGDSLVWQTVPVTAYNGSALPQRLFFFTGKMSSVSSIYAYDVCIQGGICYGVAFSDTTTHNGANPQIASFSIAANFTTHIGVAAGAPNNVNSGSLTIFKDCNATDLIVAWFEGEEVVAVGIGADLSIIHTSFWKDIGISNVALNLTGYAYASGQNNKFVLYYFANGATSPSTLSVTGTYQLVANNYAFSSPTLFCCSVQPCAKVIPFTAFTRAALPVFYFDSSRSQRTIFVLDCTLGESKVTCFTKYLEGIAEFGVVGGGPLPYGLLPECQAAPGGDYQHYEFAAVCDTGGTVVSGMTTGLRILQFTYGASDAYAKEAANNLHVTGGILNMYDGSAVSEHGFPIYPYVSISSPVTNTTVSYSYQAVYSWIDAQGQTHRSATSVEQLYTLAVPIDVGHAVSYQVTNLPFTSKSGVKIEIYRTTANGTVLYFLTQIDNNLTANASTILTDNVTDANILGRMQLYTTGGVLDNDNAPACTAITLHQNRMFLVDALYKDVIWYSKYIIPNSAGAVGVPVEFSAYFQLKVNSTGDAITGLASMDEKLVIFTKKKIYYATGSGAVEGPDDTGNGGSFTVVPLPFDVGCIYHGSIAVTRAGVMFQSEKGIWLLDRSLQASYIGQDVEPTVLGDNIVCTLVREDTNQVLFFDNNNGEIIVYDTLVGQWAVWSWAPLDNPSGVAQYLVNGAPTVVALNADGNVYQTLPWSSGTQLADDGTWIQLQTITAWIKVAGLNGFERLRRILVLGDFKSAFILNYAIFFDYKSSPTMQGSMEIDAADTGTSTFQRRIDVTQQKCEAVKIMLWDAPVMVAEQLVMGEGMALTGLTLEIGTKKGTQKVPAGSIIG